MMEVEEFFNFEVTQESRDEELYDSDLPDQEQIDPSEAFVGFSPPSSPIKQRVFETTQKLDNELKLLIDMSSTTEPMEVNQTVVTEANYEDSKQQLEEIDDNVHISDCIKMKEVPKVYLLPFEKGWKRELNLYENSGNVIYIHPLGLRFRSLDDLTPHLTDGLNAENFSFNLEPLHAGPENETITKDDPEKRLPAEMKDLSMIPTVRKSGRVPVPSSNYKIVERLEEQSRKRVVESPLINQKREKLVIKIKPLKPINSSTNGKPKTNPYASSPKGISKKGLPVGDAPARLPGDTSVLGEKPIRIRAQLRKKNTASRKNKIPTESQKFGTNRLEESTKWPTEKSGEEEPRRICTMACQKAMGVIPTLQCCVCLCLYHPECAEVGRTGSFRQIHGYICKSCRNKPDVRKPVVPPEVTPPVTPIAQPTPKPSVPQHIVTYEGLRFVIVPNLGVTAATAGPGPALPQVPAEIPAIEAASNLNLEGANVKKAVVKQEVSSEMPNLISHACSGYTVLFNVFKYLSKKELLSVAPVCRLWKDLTQNPSLWETVNLRNCSITNWKAFAKVLSQRGTRKLDLRHIENANDVDWANGYSELCNVHTLEDLKLSRVTMGTLTRILKHTPELRSCFAQIRNEEKSENDLNVFTTNHKLEELTIMPEDGESVVLNSLELSPLASTLTSLCLLSISTWSTVSISCLSFLTGLVDLQLGDCSTLPDSFSNILRSLTQLERVRLVNGSAPCLESLGTLPKLRQLELVNFDGQPGIGDALACLKNLHSFLLIPSFVTQAGTTLRSILEGMYQLRDTLKEFLWVFTLEFLHVTELYIDRIKTKNSDMGGHIPILMPLPVPDNAAENTIWKESFKTDSSGNFAVVPVSELEEMFAKALPNTKTHIFKLPLHATSKQSISLLLASNSNK